MPFKFPMDPFHTDYEGFKKCFAKEADRLVELMSIVDNCLDGKSDIKTLFDITLELRYGAEKIYKIDNNINNEEVYLGRSYVYSTEEIGQSIKEQVGAALKEFWLNEESESQGEENVK